MATQLRLGKSAETVLADISASAVISGGSPSPHPIQGIGAGFIPRNLHTALLDGTIQVEAEAAREMARRACLGQGSEEVS